MKASLSWWGKRWVDTTKKRSWIWWREISLISVNIYIPMLTGFRQQHSSTADEDRFWSQQGHILNDQHLEREHNCKALWRTWLGMRWYLQELYSLHFVSNAPLGDILALSSFSSCILSIFFHMSTKFRL